MTEENVRKLASVRKVRNITPIEGADFIELAVVDGWQCVVKKDEFKIGDLGVYFEIDSFLPIEERYEFLRKGSYRKLGEEEGFRLKTIKLRGEVSQGLILPLKTFPELPKDIAVGTDVTERLKVQKYEKPIPLSLAGKIRGNFPSYIRKTDEERIQNLLDFFGAFKDKSFEETEKLDGSSMTIFHFNGDVGVCSRNINLKLDDDENLFVTIAKETGLLEVLPEFGNIAIQGELVGQGTQGNPLGLKGTDFFVYKIWNINRQQYFEPKERRETFIKLQEKCPKIKHVPILNESVNIFEVCQDIDTMLKYAEGKSVINPQREREGLVFKCTEGEFSFKAISNKYLLGEKD